MCSRRRPPLAGVLQEFPRSLLAPGWELAGTSCLAQGSTGAFCAASFPSKERFIFFFPLSGCFNSQISSPRKKPPAFFLSPFPQLCCESGIIPGGRRGVGAVPGTCWGRALGCLCSALGAGLGAGGASAGLQEPGWGLETSPLAFRGGFAALHGAGVLPALPSVAQRCCCLCKKAKLAQTGFPAHKSTPRPLGYGLASPGGGRGPREPGRGRHEAPGHAAPSTPPPLSAKAALSSSG